MEEAVRTLLHRAEIVDLVHRYASSLDDRDWQRLASCFVPEAIAHYGPVLGRVDGFAAIERVCRATLDPLDSSQHLISNIEIEITDGAARVRSYFQAQHTKVGTLGGDNFTIGGTYLDQLVHTDSGWRIRERELCMVWQEGNPAVVAVDETTGRETST